MMKTLGLIYNFKDLSPCVRMFFHTFSFDPSRNKDRTESHGLLRLCFHQRPGTLLSQHSVEHTLNVSAVQDYGPATASRLTM